MNSPDPLLTPQSLVAYACLLIVVGTVTGVFYRGDAPTISQTVGVVLGAALSGPVGFYFGSSRGSQRKDDRAADATPAPAVITTATEPPHA